jgi:tetratricopeptide (TPR) repeat protein
MGNAVANASLRALALGALMAVAGCQEERSDQARAGGRRMVASGSGQTAQKPAAAPAEAPRTVKIPWISDDYAAALYRARAEKKPIFIDMWAPWCHTCLSMKQEVMIDASLAPFLDRFIWLEIDTDRPVNAKLLTRLHVDIWPTFYVVSPEGESVQARHLGAASIAQLREMLAQGEAGHQDAMAKARALPDGSPLALVRAGDRAAAVGEMGDAANAYGKALAAAPGDWPRTADVLVKQIAALYRAGDLVRCAELGAKESKRAGLGMTASVTDFASYADACADELDEEPAKQLRQQLSEAVSAVALAPNSALSIDDKSDALVRLRELAEKLGDQEKARAMAVRQRELLDRAVAAAKTPLGRMTHVWPRAEVYVYLGEADKLIPDLKQLEADLPKEYDPPFRLAWVSLQAGRLDEAQAAAERAMGKVYGPRKGRALSLVADIQKARGDVAAERAARKVVVDFYRSLPPGHRNEKALADARKALAAVGKPEAAAKK